MKKLDQKSAVCFLILFVLMDAILLSFYFSKKDNAQIFFFDFEHIFAPYIKNLETYFAIVICFEF